MSGNQRQNSSNNRKKEAKHANKTGDVKPADNATIAKIVSRRQPGAWARRVVADKQPTTLHAAMAAIAACTCSRKTSSKQKYVAQHSTRTQTSP